MLNVLTVDVEEHFHVAAFYSSVPPDSWGHQPSRVEKNVNRVLEILDRHGVKATFFVLGWLAERRPDLVRRIASAGHEIGCHTFAHQMIYSQTPEQFRADLRQARQVLADAVQAPVTCFRAANFSVVHSTPWAIDIIVEEGFLIDSSIFPIRHDIYGMPDAPRFPHWRSAADGSAVFEFPASTIRRFGNNWGVGGGGWMRFAPYQFTRWALQQINEKEQMPSMVYFHPWELDPDQPRIPAPLRSRVRHYTNLSTVEGKLDCLLTDFRFSTLTDVSRGLDVYRSGEKSREFRIQRATAPQ